MELPAETMTDIFVRLPVGSLLRCKSVCRSWRSLIEDPYFIAEHLKRSNSKGSSSSRFLLARYYSDSCCKYLTSLLSCETLEVLRRIEIPRPEHSGYVEIIASSNGIVCLSTDHGVSLFNPATRDFKIGDYKLIKILASSLRGNDNPDRAQVFTLKDGLWREVPASNCDIIYKFEGTVVDGVVHWIANGGGQRGSEVILSFDLGDDKFGEQPLPDIDAEDGNFKRLCAFDESLGLMVYSDSRRVGCIVIWVRSCQDLQWARLARIEPQFGVWRPVGLGARGEIFIEDNYGKLAAYEATAEVVRDICIDAPRFPVYFDFHPYVESLVPITR